MPPQALHNFFIMQLTSLLWCWYIYIRVCVCWYFKYALHCFGFLTFSFLLQPWINYTICERNNLPSRLHNQHIYTSKNYLHVGLVACTVTLSQWWATLWPHFHIIYCLYSFLHYSYKQKIFFPSLFIKELQSFLSSAIVQCPIGN